MILEVINIKNYKIEFYNLEDILTKYYKDDEYIGKIYINSNNNRILDVLTIENFKCINKIIDLLYNEREKYYSVNKEFLTKYIKHYYYEKCINYELFPDNVQKIIYIENCKIELYNLEYNSRQFSDNNNCVLLSKFYKDNEYIGKCYNDYNVDETILDDVRTNENLEFLEYIFECFESKKEYKEDYDKFEEHICYTRCDYEKIK